MVGLEPGSVVLHRNGKSYRVVDFAYDKDGDVQVIHIGLHNNETYTRSLSNFTGKHPDTGEYRFKFVS